MHNSKPSAFSCSYIVSCAIELRCVYSYCSGSAIILPISLCRDGPEWIAQCGRYNSSDGLAAFSTLRSGWVSGPRSGQIVKDALPAGYQSVPGALQARRA